MAVVSITSMWLGRDTAVGHHYKGASVFISRHCHDITEKFIDSGIYTHLKQSNAKMCNSHMNVLPARNLYSRASRLLVL